MYYFVLIDPEKAKSSLSLYFTTFRESVEYAKSVEKYNPKIIKYDPSEDYTMRYDNILHIIK